MESPNTKNGLGVSPFLETSMLHSACDSHPIPDLECWGKAEPQDGEHGNRKGIKSIGADPNWLVSLIIYYNPVISGSIQFGDLLTGLRTSYDSWDDSPPK